MVSSCTETMLAFCVANPGDKLGKTMKVPKPKPEKEGFALIRVLRAGVCNTDLEILQGYMGFQGILGHEFVGVVEEVFSGEDEHWLGKRVCGDINVGCQDCFVCRGALDKRCCQMSRNHCPHRTVLGILNRNGTMAEFLTLPVSNLHIVPDDMPDEVAVFAEPIAAACRIPEQGLVQYEVHRRVAILGDGKLGLMIAEVIGRLHAVHCELHSDSSSNPPKPILFGKHLNKLALVKDSGVDVKLVSEAQDDTAFNGVAPEYAGKFDVVVEATGSPAGLSLASGLCQPMGTLVLKSTCAAGETFNAAPFVIDELKVVGSRCGPIDKALELLALKDTDDVLKTSSRPLRVEKYITKTFPLCQAEDAIRCAAEKSTMKVQIICSERRALD